MDNTEKLIADYQNSILKHTKASRNGDYIIGNEEHFKMKLIIKELRSLGKLELLLKFLDDSDIGIRTVTAGYLFEDYKDKAIKTLTEAKDSEDFYAVIAKYALRERLG